MHLFYVQSFSQCPGKQKGLYIKYVCQYQSAEMTALRAKLSHLFWEISTAWVLLKCLNTNAHSRGNRSLHAVAGLQSHWDQRCSEMLTQVECCHGQLWALRGTGWDGQQGQELTFMWESSGDVWSFALGWISQVSAYGLGLEGRSAWVILSAYRLPDQVEGADDPVGTFMFTIPGPHRRLEPCKYLLEKKHSWGQDIQEASGVHWWQLPGTGNWGVDIWQYCLGPGAKNKEEIIKGSLGSKWRKQGK